MKVMFKGPLQWTFLVAFVFFPCNEAFSRDWHGIVPMRSTREDVIRTLDQCKDLNPSCEFSLNNEFVHIEFSSDSNLHQCDPQLKPDTVVLVEVFPKIPLSLKRFGFDSRRFKPIVASRKTTGYLDDERGVVLKTQNGKIVQIDYIAAPADRALCSSYYANPSAFIQEPFESHVPVIYVNCPPESVGSGGLVKVSADLAGNPKISFLWALSGGRIVSGQGTRLITIDPSGFEGQTIVVTVKLGRVQSSCELKVGPKSLVPPPNEFGKGCL